MRRIRLGSILVTALLVVAACGEGTATSAPAGSAAGSQAPARATRRRRPRADRSLSGRRRTTPSASPRRRRIVDRFTAASGIDVEVVAIAEDQLQAQVTAASAAGTLPDVYGALSLGFVHSLAADGITDPMPLSRRCRHPRAGDILAARALELVTVDGKLIGVPSDSWAQMLALSEGSLREGRSGATDDLRHHPGRREGAQQGRRRGHRRRAPVPPTRSPSRPSSTSRSPMGASCRRCRHHHARQPAVRRRVQVLHRHDPNGSVAGVQDADTTRAAYFAGDAAMIVWSSFLLDELAGLRDDALPTCDECAADPMFLANNSGVVTAIDGPAGSPSQFGEVVAFVIGDGCR